MSNTEPSTRVVFVAGATGYTGREVVAAARRAGARTVAHVRLDSPALDEWTRRFEGLGAEVDSTPWEEGAMRETLARIAPTEVFALLGTTRHRAKREGRGALEAYERVDYGLTALLIRSAKACGNLPRFVYLSSAGTQPGTRNPYLKARAKVEAELLASGLPYTIARPSFITGPDRDESRPMERLGAAVGDAALAFVGALGGRRVRARYRSTTNTVLGAALVRWAGDPNGENRVIESDGLR